MKRTPEVLDCWFESGSMPYAQKHYPFENKERFREDISRPTSSPKGSTRRAAGFTRSRCSSSALFVNAAFKNVIVNGIILSEDGKNFPSVLKITRRPTRC